MANNDRTIAPVSSQPAFSPNLENLIAKISRPADGNVGPGHTTDIEEQRIQDDRLWHAIRGAKGLRRIFHNAGILLTMAAVMGDECGDDCDRESNLALMVRGATLIGLLEAGLLKCFPMLPVPRFIARFAFDQYCELCSFVRAPLEWNHPDMVARFDAVI